MVSGGFRSFHVSTYGPVTVMTIINTLERLPKW